MFQQCLKLKEVQLSESMTYIDYGLFADCRSLTQITLPEKIGAVEEGAFANCIALKSIKSKALYPPLVTRNGYSSYKLGYTGKLIVPVGSKDSYVSSVGWGHCDPIVEEE